MIVTYICKQCHAEFDGHWFRKEKRNTCTKCGHININLENINYDEDFYDKYLWLEKNS